MENQRPSFIDCDQRKGNPSGVRDTRLDRPHRHGLYRLEGETGDHGFEISDPVTPHLNVSDAVDVFDPAFKDAMMAGVTCVGILPGSYISFGSSVERITIMPGQGASIKLTGNWLREQLVSRQLWRHPKGSFQSRNWSPQRGWAS